MGERNAAHGGHLAGDADGVIQGEHYDLGWNVGDGSRRGLVQAGKTGLLYRTGGVEQLASAIRFLSSQPELAEQMGRAAWEQVRRKYTPEAHYEALVGLYERVIDAKKRAGGAPKHRRTRRTAPVKASAGAGTPPRGRSGFVPLQRLVFIPTLGGAVDAPPATFQKPMLRVAFIGGRGVVSKYSGIETYYEEIGKRLTGMGHHVTAYCRSYFTPPGKQHNGVEVVRLPTIRSKHLETLVHTFLSTLHVLVQPCDVVHYHALGPALFSFIPRLAGKKTVVTVQGLDWQQKKWGRIASAVLRLGERAAVSLPSHTMVVSQALRKHYRGGYGGGDLLRAKWGRAAGVVSAGQDL